MTHNWQIYFHRKALKALEYLEQQDKKRIMVFLKHKVLKGDTPFVYATKLSGQFKNLWRYRVGDYRIIVEINDTHTLILVVHVAHRKEVYQTYT